MLVDIHAHLDSKEFENNLDEVIKRAKYAQIKVIINNGLDLQSNKKTLDISKKYEIIKSALGLYPTYAQEMSSEQIQTTLDHIQKNKNKIVAIGEVGLDFYNSPDIKKQIEIFTKVVELAEKISKPIIVHSRKAEDKVIEILSSSKIRYKILHSFTGSKNQIILAQKNEFFFSIPPNIVKSSNFQTLANLVSINKILTESDSPYLGIKKGEINEPSNITYTIKKISQLKQLDEIEVANIIFSNYQKIFLK